MNLTMYLLGKYNGKIEPNIDEVSDYCYKSIAEIEASITSHPQKYTVWFKIAFPLVQQYLAKNNTIG